jgi:DNA-binding GntR family transcriptional regulator
LKTLSACKSPSSLPEFVYGELRRAILNGVFVPGQMLRQEEVAATMGVSRSPLREALPRLEAEGIVVLLPRRGYAVTALRREQIDEAFDLRVLLEARIAAQAVARRDAADIARVQVLAAEMHAFGDMPADEAALARWADLNLAFHDALLQPADLPHTLRSLATARGAIEAYIRTELRLTGDIHQAQREHARLAEAFADGDAPAFVALTRAHANHTRARLLAGLDAQPSPPAQPALQPASQEPVP